MGSKMGFLFLLLALNACGVERIFYYPNRRLYADPDRAGLRYQLVYFPTANGNTLSGLFFPAEGESRGAVIHFHGNFANMSNHFPASYFLVRRGFDLLVFDYQGYGVSEGKPNRRNTVEDGTASVDWMLAHSTAAGRGLGIFAQSLGGAVGSVTAARDPRINAVVLEAPFTTYRAAAHHVMKQSWITWPFAWIVPPLFVRRGLDPWEAVAQIAPRPLLFIHGTADQTVPSWMSEKLFARAKEPKRLWLIEGAGHLECRRRAGSVYEKTIADFFSDAFKDKKAR